MIKPEDCKPNTVVLYLPEKSKATICDWVCYGVKAITVDILRNKTKILDVSLEDLELYDYSN